MSDPTNNDISLALYRLDDILQGLEHLRSRLIDLEAMANAAVSALEYLPFTPRAESGDVANADTESGVDAAGSDRSVQLGRLQALVISTAEGLMTTLTELNTVIDRATRTGSAPWSSTARDSAVAKYDWRRRRPILA